MRSSRSRHVVIASLAILVTSCSRTPEPDAQTEEATVECSTSGLTDARDAEAFADMRRVSATTPAYSALALLSPVRSCRGTSQSGEVALEYSFANQDTLTFTRNSAIEYSQQEARLAAPRDLHATELLRLVERASFSPDGCGMDWEEAVSSSESGATETTYYGETCNCQARVRSDGSGKTLGFVFRSAC